jgi:hypothetical protein
MRLSNGALPGGQFEKTGLANTVTGITEDRLVPGETYTWEVEVVDSATSNVLCSAGPFTFTTPALALLTPTGPGEKGFDASFSWEEYDGVDEASFGHYELQVTPIAPGMGSFSHTFDNIAGTSFSASSLSRLLAPGLYNFMVVAKDAADAPLGEAYQAAGPFTPGGLPSLTAPADAATDVSVETSFSWAAYSGASDYVLEVEDAGSNVVYTTTVAGTSHTIPDRATLNANQTYTWTVKPQDSNGDVATYAAFSFTTETLDVTGPADGDTGVGFDATFTWEEYAGTDFASLDHYELVITGGTPNTVVTVEVPAGTETASLGLAVDLLVPGVHSVTVVPKDAADAALAGGYTSNSFTTVVAPELTGVPADGAVEVELEETFTWEAYPPATDYTLEFVPTAGRSNLTVSFEVAGATTYTFPVGASLLDYGTTYRWTVKPRLDDESEVWSYDSWTFRTIDGPPLNHPLNTLTGVPSEPTFDWTTVNGSTSYRFYLSADPNFTTTALHPTLNTPASPTYIEVAPRAHTSNHTMQILRDKNEVETDFITNTPGDNVAYADLDNATTYYWMVTSVQGGKEIPSAVYSFKVTEAAKPQLDDPADAEEKTILPLTFDWHVPQNTAGLTYRLQVREVGVTDWLPASMTIDQDGITASEYTSGTNADPLLRDVDYEWRVTSYNPAQPNQTLSTVTDSDVQTFRVRGGSDTEVYPSWPVGGATVYTNTPRLAYFITEPGDGLTYRIQVRKAGSADWNVPNRVYGTSSVTDFFVDVPAGTLDPGADYEWRVRADYAAGGTSSAWSAPQTFTTNGAGTVTQPILSYPGDGATVYNTNVTLDWYLAAQETGLDYLVTVAGPGIVGSPFTAPTTALALTGLTPGATYTWSVVSRSTADSAIVSAASPTFAFTVAGGVGDGTPTASWPSGGATIYSPLPELNWYVEGDMTGITGYVVEWREVGGSGTWNRETINDPAQKSYTLVSGQELRWGQSHEWRVASTGAGGQSAWSTETFVLTPDRLMMRPIASYPVNGELFKGTSVTVSWYLNQNAAAIDRYVVNYSRTSTFDPADVQRVDVPKTRTFAELTGLIPGATYYWRVTARLTDGQWTGWSNPQGTFVLEAGSNAPVPVLGSPVNNVLVRASQPSLGWTLPTTSTSTLTYDVELSTSPDLSSPIRAVELPNPNAVLGTLEPGTYYWRARTTASSGHISGWSEIETFRIGVVSTSIDDAVGGSELPSSFALASSFPNPFSASTTIGYDVPETSQVTLAVYNALGQRVRTLVSGVAEAGTHEVDFDGYGDDGSRLAAGLYLYRLETGSTQITRTLVILR